MNSGVHTGTLSIDSLCLCVFPMFVTGSEECVLERVCKDLTQSVDLPMSALLCVFLPQTLTLNLINNNILQIKYVVKQAIILLCAPLLQHNSGTKTVTQTEGKHKGVLHSYVTRLTLSWCSTIVWSLDGALFDQCTCGLVS